MTKQTENSICECGHTLHYHKENHLFSDDGKITNCKVYKCPCKKFTPQKQYKESQLKRCEVCGKIKRISGGINDAPTMEFIKNNFCKCNNSNSRKQEDNEICGNCGQKRYKHKGFFSGRDKIKGFPCKKFIPQKQDAHKF